MLEPEASDQIGSWLLLQDFMEIAIGGILSSRIYPISGGSGGIRKIPCCLLMNRKLENENEYWRKLPVSPVLLLGGGRTMKKGQEDSLGLDSAVQISEL